MLHSTFWEPCLSNVSYNQFEAIMYLSFLYSYRFHIFNSGPDFYSKQAHVSSFGGWLLVFSRSRPNELLHYFVDILYIRPEPPTLDQNFARFA